MGIFVRLADELRPEAKEGDHFWTDAGLDRPLRPLLHIYLKFQMDKTIPQGSRHSCRHRAVRIAVSSSDNGPTIRQGVIPPACGPGPVDSNWPAPWLAPHSAR